MKASLIINGKEFGPFIKEEGIKFSKISRNSKSIITMDGTLYKTEKEAMKIQVDLLDMYDNMTIDGVEEGFSVLMSKLNTNPVVVSYSDFEKGTYIYNKEFYVSDLNYGTKTTLNEGLTFMSGASFSLEGKIGTSDGDPDHKYDITGFVIGGPEFIPV